MDAQIEQLTRRVEQTQHGFTDIRKAADELADQSIAARLKLADALYASPAHQARMLATFLYGDLAAQVESCLPTLRTVVSPDADWRVQEILANAFDRCCKDMGYERALPTIRDWLNDPSPNVRRAVSEGLRIWTARPYFKDHPDEAIALLAPHRADASDYLRKSIGNALRDISRKHPELVRAELSTWALTDRRTLFTYKLAAKFL
ncbi:MAG TPA: DNA alkylation repair protein [Phototrophicaceae bacterium]|nr:DNA alkylation repair protein [Phototrophicaceae bacterium]